MRVERREMLIERLKSRQPDFTYREAEELLGELSYVKVEKKRMSGPRVLFVSEAHAPVLLHRLPTRRELLPYQVECLIDQLEQERLL